jgi:hypothetical protein
MPQRDEAVFVVHGLDVDAKSVRADVFARKLLTLISGLREADRFVNGKITHSYMISALGTGSASVTVRQKQRSRNRPHSGIAVYEQVATAIYNGDRAVSRYPEKLIHRVGQLSAGALQTFSHAELAFSDDNVIRIDDFLARQSDAANQSLLIGPERVQDRYYRGRAIGSFDGELKEIDNRGLILRGKLLLSAGGVEIDCVMNKERVPEARNAFDKRVIIEGSAHYDGEQQLPTRIDVVSIKIINGQRNLLRWRGAFTSTVDTKPEEDDEWR